MIEIKENGLVDARQLHSELEIKTRFRGWIDEVVDRCGFEEGKQFRRFFGDSSGLGGRRSNEYDFTLDAAKEACLVTKSIHASKLRKYLISLDRQREEGVSRSGEEFLMLIDLVRVFAYHEYREQARGLQKAAYVHKLSGGKETSGWMYGQFEKWRSDTLGLGKEAMDAKLKEYCIANYARVPKKMTQAEVLTIVDKYELIKNAVWDLLMSKSKSDKYVQNTCILAKELAKKLEPEFKRWNERTLFAEKEEAPELKVLNL